MAAAERSRLWLARGWLFVALAGAFYLAFYSFSKGPVAGCGPGSGCDRVLSSRWAYWLGIPVSLPAIAVYGALLRATWKLGDHEIPARRSRWRLSALALSGLVWAAALWFASLQHFVLGSWCKFCLATHSSAVLGTLFLVSLLRRSPVGEEPGGRPAAPLDWARGLGLSLAGMSMLVLGQLAVKPRLYALTRFAAAPSSPSRKLVLFGGHFAVDPDQLPLLGPSTAPHFVVSLVDYTCEHCRHMHPLLKAAAAHFGGQVAILVLPMPLDADCNPMIRETQPLNFGACDYARLALAVWRAKPPAFPEFDDWLFNPDGVPSLEDARAKAEALVGGGALDRALADPWVKRQIALDVNLYIANSQAMGDSHLPQLIFGDAGSSGEMDDAGELEQLIASHAPLTRHP